MPSKQLLASVTFEYGDGEEGNFFSLKNIDGQTVRFRIPEEAENEVLRFVTNTPEMVDVHTPPIPDRPQTDHIQTQKIDVNSSYDPDQWFHDNGIHGTGSERR